MNVDVNDSSGTEALAPSPEPHSTVLAVSPVNALPAAAAGEIDIAALIKHGMDAKVDVVAMKGLFEMAKEMQAMAAERIYAAAFATFQATCPPIVQRSESDQFQRIVNGIKVNRPYASLEDICRVVGPVLSVNGLSYQFGDAAVEDGRMSMWIRVLHVSGHKTTVSLSMPMSSNAGASALQKDGTTLAYLRRHLIVNAFGLWSVDPDTDGKEEPPAPDTDSGEPMSCEQVTELEDLLEQCPDGTKARLLKSYDVPGIFQLQPAQFEHCKTKLRATIKKAKEMEG